ncbi:YLS9 protein [Spatholobus suberectus]|nr:YLS9 protein [Spatholobus suberectus]
MVLNCNQASYFNEDGSGVIDIDVRLFFTIRFRLGDFIGDIIKPKANCGLEVSYGSNRTTMNAFRPTKCNFDFLGTVVDVVRASVIIELSQVSTTVSRSQGTEELSRLSHKEESSSKLRGSVVVVKVTQSPCPKPSEVKV